jgi:hypothetical protein
VADEKLPPLIQEIRVDAAQALSEHSRFEDSTKHMAEGTVDANGRMRDAHGRFVSTVAHGTDELEGHNRRAHGSFLELVGGLGAANLAADGVEKTLEGLHKVIETGIDRAKDDAQINSQLAAGLTSTGGAAGTTVKGMDDLAESIARMSGQSADSIGKTESLLLTFTNIKNVGPDKIFDETTLAAANMAARFGGDATQSAVQLGKALNDPVKGMTALRRVGVSFTADQTAQVKALQASGDMMGAQKIILGELNTEFGNSAKAAGQTLPGAMARAKESFEEMSGKVVSALLPAITPIFSKMVDLFQSMAPHIEKFADMLASGLEKIGPILAPIGAAISQAFKAAEPALASFGGMFKQLEPTLAQLIPVVANVIQQISPFGIILKALGPVLPQIASTVVTLAQTLGGDLATVLQMLAPILAQVVQTLAGALSGAIVALLPAVSQLAGVVGQVLVAAVTAVAPLLKPLASLISEILGAVVPLIPPILGLVSALLPLLVPIIQLVGSLLTPLIQLLTVLLQPILQLVTGMVQMLVPALQLVVQWFTNYITPIIRDAQNVFQGLSDFISGVFSGNWSQAWHGIQEIFSGVWDGIKNIASGALNGVIDLVNGAIGTIDDALAGISKATGGIINLNIPKIPHASFDVGTDRVPGGEGQPVPAVVHGGEAILSNGMLAGQTRIPQRAVDAVHRQDGQATAVAGAGTQITQNVSVTQTNPSAEDIAAALGFAFRTLGG